MNKFQKAIHPILTFARIDIRRLFRDKVAIFFVFLFPLAFLFILGTISSSGSDVSFRTALINDSKTQFAGQFEKQIRDNKLFEIDKDATTLDAAKQKLNRGQLDTIVVLPSGFGETKAEGYPTGEAQILYDKGSQQAASALQGAMNDGLFKGINNRLVPYEAPFSAVTKSTDTTGISQFDYTFAGIFGFTLLSLGVFGPTQVFPRLKQKGVLRRYRMTTLRVWQYFLANVLSNAYIGLLAAGVMFFAAVQFFDLQMQGSYINLAVITILGVVMLFGIGLAIGGWAKNENQAAPLAQLFTLPMMFLSGVFFPVYLMPDFLQKVTQFIPLSPVVESVRRIIAENASLLDLAPQIGIMAAWTFVIYIVAFRLFRWE